MSTTIRAALALLLAFGLVAAGAACGSDDDGDDVSTDDSTGEAAGGGELEVSDVWARTTAGGQDAGAVYLVITGGAEDDELVSASVDASVAGTVELHETVTDGDDAEMDMSDDASEDEMDTADDAESSEHDHSDDTTADDATGDEMDGMDHGDGTMSMQPVDGIEVPAGEEVVLEPGGYHVMLLELAEPLEEGETFDLTLTFAEAGEQTVTVEVRDR